MTRAAGNEITPAMAMALLVSPSKASISSGASTRTCSPGGSSSISSDDLGCVLLPPPEQACTVSAERAVLDDLGLVLHSGGTKCMAAPGPTYCVDAAGSSSESCATVADGTLLCPQVLCITGTAPKSGSEDLIGEAASQRRPPPTLARPHVSVTNDASQRMPMYRFRKPIPISRGESPANWRNNCVHERMSDPSGGGTSWSPVLASAVATRVAAAACVSPAVHEGTYQVPTEQMHWGSGHTEVVPETDALKRWLSCVSGTSTLSADCLADRLRAAAPEIYED